MKKIILALSAIALVVSCSQSRKWTDKERDEVRKVVRDRHDRSAIRHMEAKNYTNLEECVVTTIEETYPDYNRFDKLTGKTDTVDAVIVGQNIARQLEGRVSFRRAVKMAVASTMRMGAEGIKIQVAGRVGGAEMARTETIKEGRIPLHTFRADIDYCLTEALTKVGILGVKVWICQGIVYGKRDLFEIAGASAQAPSGDRGERGDRRGGRGDRGDRRGGDRRGGDRRGGRGDRRNNNQ